MKYLLGTCILFIYIPIFASFHGDTSLSKVIQKHYHIQKNIPSSHAVFNKDVYIAGESVYFNNYTQGFIDHGDILVAELFNFHGKLISRRKFIIENNKSYGQIELSDTLSSGYYLLRIYPIGWNEYSEEIFTHKWIKVISSSNKSKPTVPSSNKKISDLPIKITTDTSIQYYYKIKIATTNNSKDSLFNAVLYHSGEVLAAYAVQLTEKKPSIIAFSKFILKPGINFLTFYNASGQPIIQKVFFKEIGDEKPPLIIGRVQDTVNFILESKQMLNGSISVLPNSSNALFSYKKNQLLINTPDYIFKQVGIPANPNASAKELNRIFLDLEFVNPSWNIAAKELKANKGVSIEGVVTKRFSNKPQPESKVLLTSPENQLLLTCQTNKDGKFTFDNLFLKDTTQLLLYATDLNGGDKFKRHIKAKIVEPEFSDSIDILPWYSLIPKEDTVLNEQKSKPQFVKNIDLKEVEIKGKKTPNPFQGDPWVSTIMDKIFIVDKKVVKENLNMDDLLRYCGVSIYDLEPPGIYIGNNTSIYGRIIELKNKVGIPPVVFINGVEIKQNGIEILYGLSASQIEAIAIDRSYIGCCFVGPPGAFTQYGAIKVKTRNIPLALDELTEQNPIKLKVTKGINGAVSFDKSRNTPYSVANAEEYLPIHWENIRNAGPNKTTQIKVPLKEKENALVWFQWVDENGINNYMINTFK